MNLKKISKIDENIVGNELKIDFLQEKIRDLEDKRFYLITGLKVNDVVVHKHSGFYYKILSFSYRDIAIRDINPSPFDYDIFGIRSKVLVDGREGFVITDDNYKGFRMGCAQSVLENFNKKG